MLGSSIAMLQATSTLPPTMIKATKAMTSNASSSESAPAPSPAWVPWAVGAALGGVVLYFLVRK